MNKFFEKVGLALIATVGVVAVVFSVMMYTIMTWGYSFYYAFNAIGTYAFPSLSPISFMQAIAVIAVVSTIFGGKKASKFKGIETEIDWTTLWLGPWISLLISFVLKLVFF